MNMYRRDGRILEQKNDLNSSAATLNKNQLSSGLKSDVESLLYNQWLVVGSIYLAFNELMFSCPI